ncbi:hypothetical protein M011DRAFT_467447 [Sporormia fimetaria CBS 119925]|uniref:Uncharacterized protein n=1 Tax=Sporormia fimetaria CBS 119925 TaxID=1340428 RepID=A0A6A6VDP3_9PLEO|nr:hypothetical protein M011DRAFT_467447 [Sporormia fimetaria CBS 119925]
MQHVPAHDLSTCIPNLAGRGQLLQDYMLSIAKMYPHVAETLRVEYEALLQQERRRTIDFNHHSKSVWHAINSTGRGMKGSKAFEASFGVCHNVCDTIEEIGEQAGAEWASFQTRRSGLETLRKIGKTICLSEDVIGHEVRKEFGSNTDLEDAMFAILERMTPEEREQMCSVVDEKGSFIQKMEELQKLSKSYCILEELPDVISLLKNKDEGGDEDVQDNGDNA